MRLISHNLLQCNKKACENKNNFPLAIHVQKSIIQQTEFKKESIIRLVKKLDWAALYATIYLVNFNKIINQIFQKLGEKNFPKEFSQQLLENEEFLRQLHLYILETHILEGYLQCNNCGTQYPVQNGIPNMILSEDEY